MSTLSLDLAKLLHLFSQQGFLLPVFYRGRFLEVFPALILPDNTFLLNHTLKTFDGFFQRFVVVNSDIGDLESPPLHV